MPRDEKSYHPNFIEYVNFIINHPAYKGLPIEQKSNVSYKFVVAKNTTVGRARKGWIEQKAREFGYEVTDGVYAKVMRQIHPTKKTTCQICGRSLSIYYHYLGKNAVKFFSAEYGFDYSTITHINEVWDDFIHYGFSHEEIGSILFEKCHINDDPNQYSKDEIIDKVEKYCRIQGGRFLGPGAMSNAPDRFDGFHSYNRCCREIEDRGRHKENMNKYNRDRRAYERWSDGNIRAANIYMKSNAFKDVSADHVGPISLGFVHDPRYLRPMVGADNSARQNNLSVGDVKKLIQIEEKTGISAVSWYAKDIWDFIKNNYKDNKPKVAGDYKKALQQNFANFMLLLNTIMSKCGEHGEEVLAECFLRPNYYCFEYNYTFGDEGSIVKQTKRRKTERCRKEFETYKRIAITAAKDYFEKDNRRIKPNVQEDRMQEIHTVCDSINQGQELSSIMESIIRVMSGIQADIISTL